MTVPQRNRLPNRRKGGKHASWIAALDLLVEFEASQHFSDR